MLWSVRCFVACICINSIHRGRNVIRFCGHFYQFLPKQIFKLLFDCIGAALHLCDRVHDVETVVCLY